jgi:hypothetical protein
MRLQHLHFKKILLLLFFNSTGDQTQGFAGARQMLDHRATTLAKPFAF